MFAASAARFIEYEQLVYGYTKGRAGKFRPGRALHPAGDTILRQKVQPVAEEYITPYEDMAIRAFDVFNVIFLSTAAQLFQWLGMWNLFAYYVWPYDDQQIRDCIYFLVGLLLTAVSMRYFNVDSSYQSSAADWDKGVPKSFGWSSKLDSYLRKIFNFMGYVLIWVGAWDFLDVYLIDDSIVRDIGYIVAPIFVSYILEELLSPESLYFFTAFSRHNKSKKNDYSWKDNQCALFRAQIFKIGENLTPSQDHFVRTHIQPAVKNYISPFEDWAISIFNWINSLLLVTVVQLFLWVGMWDSFADHVWPYDNLVVRDSIYVCLGFLIMLLSYSFFSLDKSYIAMEDSWHNGFPIYFGMKRKTKDFAREMLSFLGFLFVWVGAWDFLDTMLWEDNIIRDVLYVVISFAVSFLLEEILAVQSLYYMVVKFKMLSSKKEDKTHLNETA